jgi:hypothetical protein
MQISNSVVTSSTFPAFEWLWKRKTNTRSINIVCKFTFFTRGALNSLHAHGHAIQRYVEKNLESARKFRLYSLF